MPGAIWTIGRLGDAAADPGVRHRGHGAVPRSGDAAAAGGRYPLPAGVQGNSTRAIVPEPFAPVNDSVPPAASTRAR